MLLLHFFRNLAGVFGGGVLLFRRYLQIFVVADLMQLLALLRESLDHPLSRLIIIAITIYKRRCVT
jgi:hypothetical protein